jgi:hypothetical protein
VEFSPSFSVEADALFRELRFNAAPTVTWEFPILAKYRFSSSLPGPLARTFLEAGPSFRTTGNLNANPSHTGISAGAGVALPLDGTTVAPMIRHTRWAKDNVASSPIQSRRDQLELLVGFSRLAPSDLQPLGKRVSLGAVVGFNLTDDYNSISSTGQDLISGSPITFLTRSGARGLIVGPSVEVSVLKRLSVEADAIHENVRSVTTVTGPAQPANASFDSSAATWQFPILAKYRLPVSLATPAAQPFVELGPSFLIPQTVTNYGATAGGGVEMPVSKLKVAPELRFTRWQSDPVRGGKANQAKLLMGILF